MTHSKVECSKATRALSTQNQTSNDELDGSAITKNEFNSIQDHFSPKFVSIIRETVMNLLSPTNTQTISFLLKLLPTFPPAAILGSFVMVILSVLQSPSMLSLLQQTLSNVASLLQNPGSVSIPDHFIDLDGIDMNGFYGMNDAVEYGTNLSNEVFQTQDRDDETLYSRRVKFDRFAQPTKMSNRMEEFLNRKKQSRVDEDYDAAAGIEEE